MTATDKWLENSPLPKLTGADATAEKLVLLTHFGADFDIWGGSRRVRYWDALAENVKASTYAGPSLSDWWSSIAPGLPSQPRNEEERQELALLLASENQRDVLKALRQHSEVLTLRTRVIAEQWREDRSRKRKEHE